MPLRPIAMENMHLQQEGRTKVHVKSCILWMFPLLFAFSSSVTADEGRYQDYVVGARAMGLGGAFTAIADDSSGVFYNPAGIVDVRKGSLSISTSLYGLEFSGVSMTDSSALERRLRSGVSSADVIIIPSATGGVRGLGKPLENGSYRHAVAFGTIVPQYTSRFVDTEQVDGDTNLLTRFRSSVYDRTLHAGAAYAYRAGRWFRLGASLHYILRSLNSDETLVTRDEQDFGRFQVAESQLRSRTHSARASFGFKFHPGPRWTFGGSVTTPSMGIWRSVAFLATEVSSNSSDENDRPDLTVLTYENDKFDLGSHLPGKLRMGFAFTEPANFTLAADLIFYGPSEYDIISNEVLEQPGAGARLSQVPIPLRIRRNTIGNACIGVEKLVSSRVSVSVGLFTNFTSAEPLEYNTTSDGTKVLTNSSTRLSNVHMAGGSFSVGFFNDNSLSRLGVTGSAGLGETVVPLAPELRFGETDASLQVIDSAESYIYIFWSSTFRYGKGKRKRGLSF